MRVLDLFSGIGGFSLGLERTGMKTVAFCEIDPYCRRVLAKHWPGVPIYEDVRALTASRLAADGIIEAVADTTRNDVARRGYSSTDQWHAERDAKIPSWGGIDVICGGFPCQDISVAGKGAGIDGARSGLWAEFSRIIGEVRPRYVIVENVAALLGRGIARVLGDLASLGFDAEWHCIPASAVGAPHRRDRVWIIGYAMGDSTSSRCNWSAFGSISFEERIEMSRQRSEDVADADEPGSQRRPLLPECSSEWTAGQGCVADASSASANSVLRSRSRLSFQFGGSGWSSREHWFIESDVGRVANGVPARVDRLRSLGNAVVPQIPELIGRAIMEARA